MTPNERIVLETALKWSRTEVSGDDLLTACRAFEAERATHDPANRVVRDLTWGEIVEGDEVWSAKAAKWFVVQSAVRHTGARVVLVQMRGVAKRFEQKVGDPVRVRRGETGEAIEILNQILWSMPATPETTKGDDA